MEHPQLKLENLTKRRGFLSPSPSLSRLNLRKLEVMNRTDVWSSDQLNATLYAVPKKPVVCTRPMICVSQCKSCYLLRPNDSRFFPGAPCNKKDFIRVAAKLFFFRMTVRLNIDNRKMITFPWKVFKWWKTVMKKRQNKTNVNAAPSFRLPVHPKLLLVLAFLKALHAEKFQTSHDYLRSMQQMPSQTSNLF